jgi:large subunit ribosomal protein L10
MDRTQKEAAVAELTGHLKDAEAIFAVDYRGISVTEASELRVKLADSDAVFKVVKNRLAKLAAKDAGNITELDELLVGPTALTLIKGDPVTAAKTIADFAKEHEELEYKGGIMDGAALDPEGFMVIARLPGVDVLHGQLVGLAASPLTGLVAGLSNMISGLGRQLAQVAEQGLVTGEAPASAAEEAPAEEPAAEEAPEEPAAEPESEAPAEAEAAEENEADDGVGDGESAEAEEPPADEPAEAEAPAEETSETEENESEDE